MLSIFSFNATTIIFDRPITFEENMKLNLRIPIVFLALLLLLSGCQKKEARVLQNTITDEHVWIPGTKVSIIPPPDFVPAPDWPGYAQQSTTSSVMVVEIPGPFAETVAGFDQEDQMASRGMDLISKEDLKFDQYPAQFLEINQSAFGVSFAKWILVFGDENHTVMVNGVYPKGNEALSKDIRKAVESTVYEPEKEFDPLDAVNFSIDVAGTPLQLTTSMGGSLAYTKDGEVPTASEDGASFMVSNSLGEYPVEDPEEFTQLRLEQLDLGFEVETESFQPITIDDMEGYEALAYGTNEETGNKELVLLTMLYTESKYYIMTGLANGGPREQPGVVPTGRKDL